MTTMPAVRKKELKDQVLSVRILQRLFRALEWVAEREDRSVAYITRQALEDYADTVRPGTRRKK